VPAADARAGSNSKNTGLDKLPFFDFAANQAKASIAALAFDLVSWIQLTTLPDGHHAKAWDIKSWRYPLFATAGKIITRPAATSSCSCSLKQRLKETF
jgi:hypothetical protein